MAYFSDWGWNPGFLSWQEKVCKQCIWLNSFDDVLRRERHFVTLGESEHAEFELGAGWVAKGCGSWRVVSVHPAWRNRCYLGRDATGKDGKNRSSTGREWGGKHVVGSDGQGLGSVASTLMVYFEVLSTFSNITCNWSWGILYVIMSSFPEWILVLATFILLWSGSWWL